MKKIFICTTLFIFAGMVFATAPAGKSSLAGQIYGSSGTEIAYGKMASSSTMYLLGFNVAYNTGSSEVKYGDKTEKGPKVSSYSINLFPEFRTYMRPEGSVSPYWGIYGLVGLSSSKSEPPDASTTIASSETTTSATSYGAGLTVGAEYFLNKTISLSANTRILQLTFSSQKNESGSDITKQESTTKNMALQLGISAAIYLRIYF
jgi:hypothetical protein